MQRVRQQQSSNNAHLLGQLTIIPCKTWIRQCEWRPMASGYWIFAVLCHSGTCLDVFDQKEESRTNDYEYIMNRSLSFHRLRDLCACLLWLLWQLGFGQFACSSFGVQVPMTAPILNSWTLHRIAWLFTSL